MTKLTSKIATALAILGLAGPALAATGSESTTAAQPAPAQVQQPTKKHTKVAAQSDEKKATSEKKATTKKSQKKHKSHASSTASSAKTNESAPAPAAPAPASK